MNVRYIREDVNQSMDIMRAYSFIDVCLWQLIVVLRPYFHLIL